MAYTLQEASARLGMDPKTLKRRLAEMGITPQPDEADRRRLLLSDKQLAQIPPAQKRETIKAMRDEIAALTQQVNLLDRHCREINQQLVDLREDYRVVRGTVLTIMHQMAIQTDFPMNVSQ